MDGEGVQVTSTVHFKCSKSLGKKSATRLDQYTGLDKKQRRLTLNVSDCNRLVFLCAYSTIWFKLSRVKLYGNDLKGKQYYFKLVEG